ncbi:MAG: hypothetical protein K5989_00755 [Lachnospiraceae bacterium]|nr:hypothetical protein [Lachnospiraceae bacterium]
MEKEFNSRALKEEEINSSGLEKWGSIPGIWEKEEPDSSGLGKTGLNSRNLGKKRRKTSNLIPGKHNWLKGTKELRQG